MAERFDSWRGFLDAGFVAAEDGSLRLGDAVASYSVAKEAGGLRVKFSGDVPGYEDIAFSLPTEVDDFYEWVARIAYGTFGAAAGGGVEGVGIGGAGRPVAGPYQAGGTGTNSTAESEAEA